MRKSERVVVKIIKASGYKVVSKVLSGKSHIRWELDNGQFLLTSNTPKSMGQEVKIVTSKLRRMRRKVLTNTA